MKLCKLTLLLFLIAVVPILGQIGNNIQINGYSSFEFEKLFGEEGKGDPNGSFDADLFDIVLNVRASDRLRVAADITWEHGAASEDGRGNVAVEYAFGEYMVNNWLKFRAGKMFTHFGIYNEIHTAKPAMMTVKEPLSTNKNQKFGSDDKGGRFYPRWVTGVAILGNLEISDMDADYIVQITNGEQENTNPFEEDDNTEKAVSGRFRIWPTYDLQLGASFYTDKISELDDEGEDAGKRSSLLSYGVQANWNPNKFGLEAEYVMGSFSPSVGDGITRYAYTIMGTYNVLPRVTPYVRYEFLDPDIDAEDDVAHMFVYGINYQVTNGLNLKGELNTVISDEMNSRFEGVNYTEFKFAVAIGF